MVIADKSKVSSYWRPIEQSGICNQKEADRQGTEHPNLHLSPEERQYFGQLFAAADTDKIGVVTGEVAVKFFEKTRLPPTTLGEVRRLEMPYREWWY